MGINIDPHTGLPIYDGIQVFTGLSFGEWYMNEFKNLAEADGGIYNTNTNGYQVGKIKDLGILDAASFIFLPSAVKAGVLYTTKPFLTGKFSADRNCVKSRINKGGLIENVAAHVASIDYTDTDAALLTEPQRTNLITYPVSFLNAYWTKSGASIDDNNGNGYVSPHIDFPAGTYKLVEDNADSPHFIRSVGHGNDVGTFQTFTVYAKKGERSFMCLSSQYSSPYGSMFAYFDLENGVIGTTGNLTTAKIQYLSNGFYKCSITAERLLVNVTGYDIRCANADNSDSYQGDGVSGIYIFGAQLEDSEFPTSFIYDGTEGATKTRLADQINNAGDSSIFNSTEGVLYAEIAALADDLTHRYISISDGTENNIVSIRFGSSSNQLKAFVYNGLLYFDASHTVPDETEFLKIAVKWKHEDFAMWVNGTPIVTGTVSFNFPPQTLSTLQFNKGAGSSPFYGKTKSVFVFNQALTDSLLKHLTSL